MLLLFKGLRGEFLKTVDAYFKSCLVIFQVLLIPRAGAEATFPPVLVGVKINGGDFTYGLVAVSGMHTVDLQCIAIRATTIQWRNLDTNDLQPEWNSSADGSRITLQLASDGTKNYSRFEGTYECAASNNKGLALSSPIRLIIPWIKTDFRPGMVAPVKNLYWSTGSLLIVQCNTSPVTFHPDMATVTYPRRIVWFFANTTGHEISGSFQRLELPNVLPSSVVAYDGTLIIRRQLSMEKFIDIPLECRIAAQDTRIRTIYNLEISLGKYLVSIGRTSFSNAPGQSITLAYKSNDIIMLPGESASIVCVFDDPGNSIQNVSWSKLTGEPLQPDLQYFHGGMAKLGILSAQYRHSGIYSCSYPGTNEMGRIEVQVIRYPIISSSLLKDYYAVVDSTATLVCLVDIPADAGFIWKYNDRILLNDGKVQVLHKSQLQSELTIKDLELQDTGVVTCRASNAYGTTVLNVRLIVYKPSRISIIQLQPTANGNKTKTRTNELIFQCSYSTDPRANNFDAKFSITQLPNIIDSKTSDPRFGISSGSVVRVTNKVWQLRLQYNPDLKENYRGQCKCHAIYTILNHHVSESEATSIFTGDNQTEVDTVGLEYWWIAIIVGCLAVVLVAVMTVSIHVLTKTTAAINLEDIPSGIENALQQIPSVSMSAELNLHTGSAKAMSLNVRSSQSVQSSVHA